MNIRLLNANEIECRVQSVKKTGKGVGCILLLYKDARCDMKILDEVFGCLGWEREHQLINGNLFCTIRVWDSEKKMWINKQDVGTESMTEKEKGQASDSFKRACFNLGIGRELYTSPFIWVNLNDGEYSENKDKLQVSPFLKFEIKNIGYNEEREISQLEIIDNKGNSRFKLGSKSDYKPVETTKPTNNTNIPADINSTPTEPNNAIDDILQCASCKTKITKAVHDYSTKKFGKQLCVNCQKKHSIAS